MSALHPDLLLRSSDLDLLPEPVRMVVWDLDETFWKGTLTEGGAEHVAEHEEIVIELARRGIVSSICSKNDFDEVARHFAGRDVWNYWVFARIDWNAKGPKLKALVEASNLRPESILFIDDNHMMREEARHFVPGMQVASEAVIPMILDHHCFVGKPDPEMTRLQQYKLLEVRQTSAATNAASAEDFLRDSKIVVEIDYDVEKHLDRAIELVNRTNQLNFTKNRLPDDIVAAREVLRNVLRQYNIQSGMVKVRDRFGDYGIIGFYVEEKSVHPGSHLYQFCFSCRILGMKIETWLYRMLGRPPINIAANVGTDILDEHTQIDWIQFGRTDTQVSEGSSHPLHHTAVLLRGGCEIMPLEHYFEPIAKETLPEFAYNREGVQQRIEHSQFAGFAITPPPDEAMASFRQLGYVDGDFQSAVFSDAYPDGVRICTFWADYTYRLYRHKRTGMLIPFSAFPATSMHQDLTKFPIDQLTAEYRGHWIESALRHLADEYEDVGLISDEQYRENLRILLGAIPKTAPVFILGAHEYGVADEAGERPIRHWLRNFNAITLDVCNEFENAEFIAASSYLTEAADLEPDESDHFNRLAYYRMFQLIVDKLLGAATDTRGSQLLS